jgi:hypothetical protein
VGALQICGVRIEALGKTPLVMSIDLIWPSDGKFEASAAVKLRLARRALAVSGEGVAIDR